MLHAVNFQFEALRDIVRFHRVRKFQVGLNADRPFIIDPIVEKLGPFHCEWFRRK